jgi:hypothetical protein
MTTRITIPLSDEMYNEIKTYNEENKEYPINYITVCQYALKQALADVKSPDSVRDRRLLVGKYAYHSIERMQQTFIDVIKEYKLPRECELLILGEVLCNINIDTVLARWSPSVYGNKIQMINDYLDTVIRDFPSEKDTINIIREDLIDLMKIIMVLGTRDYDMRY